MRSSLSKSRATYESLVHIALLVRILRPKQVNVRASWLGSRVRAACGASSSMTAGKLELFRNSRAHTPTDTVLEYNDIDSICSFVFIHACMRACILLKRSGDTRPQGSRPQGSRTCM